MFYRSAQSPRILALVALLSAAPVAYGQDVTITEIPYWNCCGAATAPAEGGERPRRARSARTPAPAEPRRTPDGVCGKSSCSAGVNTNPSNLAGRTRTSCVPTSGLV